MEYKRNEKKKMFAKNCNVVLMMAVWMNIKVEWLIMRRYVVKIFNIYCGWFYVDSSDEYSKRKEEGRSKEEEG